MPRPDPPQLGAEKGSAENPHYDFGLHEPTPQAINLSNPMKRSVFLILATVTLIVCGCKPSTPLKSEFYQSKYGSIYFKLWIEDRSALPYDNFVIKLTKIEAPSGERFSNSFTISKDRLINGAYMNSIIGVGYNPHQSNCMPGDSYIIEIPKYPALVIDVPDSASGLKVIPHAHHGP